MTAADRLKAAGTSPAAIRHHYDLSDEFFGLWLGPDMVYSCALWDAADREDSLALAQRRKLEHFATRLRVRGGRVLDVGCGWGALLDRFVSVHGAAGGVGLTLSPGQAEYASRRRVPGVAYTVQSWVDHEPDDVYDAITCIEATEHFASDALTPDDKVDVYQAFFERCASWLRPGGRLGLQLICLDNVGHAGSRPGRGPFSDLIGTDIFPESMPGSLSELVLGWESSFELVEFLDHTDHYRRTFRAWALAGREHETRARVLVGPGQTRVFARYFAAGEAAFRLREHSLHRVVLARRPEPKVWVSPPRPGRLDRADPPPGASAAAVRSHYDISNDFYALWLGPSMMYSSGLWDPADDPAAIGRAHRRKIDFFAARVLPGRPARVLDVGCGWGGNLRRLVDAHAVSEGIGLTISPAQCDFSAQRPVPGVAIRLQDWTDHHPDAAYDAIVSYGAFEHFARDGTNAAERVAVYRRFFARCFEWLAPDGRLGLETIAHDGAPDTDAPRGRGPLGDFVLDLFPESIAPHLCELVLGFEPYFEVEVLRSDPDDFARTFRVWQVALRTRGAEAETIVGEPLVRRFRRYLAASEVQFRTRTLTNYRVVLRRRPTVRV
jgi:cyclopropane-fatty-acyl-phospholipid synthase